MTLSVPYDVFTDAFLQKVTEYDFIQLSEHDRNHLVDGYMKRAIAAFKKICKYDLTTTADDVVREFDVDIEDEDLEEIADIISDGMIVQWLKPYTFKQENLEAVLTTRDFSTYSPAELLRRVSEAHTEAKKAFTNAMREYSYNHGDLSELHL